MIRDTIALEKLAERIKTKPTPVDNSSLYAGSPMFFYCKVCGHPSDTKDESYVTPPLKYCGPCQELKEAEPGLTDGTLTQLGVEANTAKVRAAYHGSVFPGPGRD